ncbi:hypothetical protein NFX46_16405 [Streptomyces phaeoluteigriseus]|uniref:Uncharacterized protein n=1 Tax=Streptomyces phaeoluteigriseus TaxID=114686 RepID=A0ABY4Z8C7_9ACTN|nr:hypothetical protein [Streptomyces phaeoluteigriseus]USQ85226.1 hypothetical protein NFX46_16405 [Streptomyces phaeoluteigriseus]
MRAPHAALHGTDRLAFRYRLAFRFGSTRAIRVPPGDETFSTTCRRGRDAAPDAQFDR